VSYALFLGYGFLAAESEGIGEVFQRQWRAAAALGVLVFVAASGAYAAAGGRVDPFTDMDPPSMAFRLLKSVGAWVWVVAILGLARSRIASSRRSPARTATDQLDRPSVGARLGTYANEAVLPFYVLHGHRGRRLFRVGLADRGRRPVLPDRLRVAGCDGAGLRALRPPHDRHPVPVRPQAHPRTRIGNPSPSGAPARPASRLTSLAGTRPQ
jgi:hypothetical protein